MPTPRLLDSVPLLTRTALLARGHTAAELRRRRAPDGDLVTVGRGVYVERLGWESCTEVERHRVRTAAALLLTDPATVASHGSSAVLHGVATLFTSIRTVHLTRPDAGTVKNRTNHRLHGGTLHQDEIVEVRGLPATALARTTADVVRCDGWLPGLVVADQALRSGVTIDQLVHACDRQRGLPGTACFDRLLTHADAGADNPGETLARALVLEVTEALGLPAPETQFRVQGGRTAYADLRVGRLLIEFDGRWKYARDRPFDEGRAVEEVVWEEKRREDWLREQGFVVVRLTWDDVWGRGREAARRRLLSAVVRHSGLAS